MLDPRQMGKFFNNDDGGDDEDLRDSFRVNLIYQTFITKHTHLAYTKIRVAAELGTTKK